MLWQPKQTKDGLVRSAVAFGVVVFSSPEMQRLLDPCHAEVGAVAREARRLRSASIVWYPNRAKTPVSFMRLHTGHW